MFKNLGEIISKFTASILLILLILSFAVWGIGDVFRGRVSDTVAKVGDTTISRAELDSMVSYEARRMQEVFGGLLTEEQIRSLGLEQKVLSTMINRRLMELQARELGIRVSNKKITDMISSDYRFKGPDGRFDKNRFLSFLRNSGESEASFMAKLKTDAAVDILVSSLTSPYSLPAPITRKFHEYEGEKREAMVLSIPSGYIKETRDPENTELLSFYNEKKEDFAAPEYREISYITITPDDIKGQIDVGEETLREQYEQRSHEFSVPEERDILHMFLPDEKTAKEAYQALKEGGDFFEVSKEKAGLDKKDVQFGFADRPTLSQGGIIPDEVVDEVFSLEEGRFTEPQESSLGIHIFKVRKIREQKTKSYEEVKDEIRKDIIEEQAGDLLYRLSTRLEDELAAGSSLEEAAENLNLELNKTGAVSAEGKVISGQVPREIPEFGDFLSVAFNTEEGDDSGVVTSEDGLSYFVLRVDGVIPTRLRALDEVRGLAAEAWKEEERKKELGKFAQQAAANIKRKLDAKNKDAVESEASMLMLKEKPMGPFYRDGKKSGLPEELVEELFSIKKGKSTSAYVDEKGNYLIGQLTGIIAADEDDSAFGIKAVERGTDSDVGEELLSQYILYLKTKYTVEYTGT